MKNQHHPPLIFAHIGDLHITDAKAQNYKDFLSITAQIATELKDQVDFVLLPGDNADNGLLKQYQLIKPVLKMLDVPVFALTGDHDMEQGNLNNFYQSLGGKRLPFKETIKDVNCIFLDVCGPGSGGPDFRLGDDQLQQLEQLISNSPNLLFMHTYPDDLKDPKENERLLRLINEHDIALINMGHTHYNEIANSGKTIYTATRSTSQIVEGPVGYSITSIDQGVVSWRFRHLEDPFPFVMITSPADHRLYRASNTVSTEIRATILGATPIKQARCFTANQSYDMDFDPNRKDWFTRIKLPDTPTLKITVEAITIDGRPGIHSIEIATPSFSFTPKGRDGSDELRIGAWPENSIPGTQLGPNRNA